MSIQRFDMLREGAAPWRQSPAGFFVNETHRGPSVVEKCVSCTVSKEQKLNFPSGTSPRPPSDNRSLYLQCWPTFVQNCTAVTAVRGLVPCLTWLFPCFFVSKVESNSLTRVSAKTHCSTNLSNNLRTMNIHFASGQSKKNKTYSFFTHKQKVFGQSEAMNKTYYIHSSLPNRNHKSLGPRRYEQAYPFSTYRLDRILYSHKLFT
jgi:hypothetical protein